MKTAAAYIRVSTDDQIEFSPDSQLAKIRDYAKRNGYILPSEYIYIDEGISGRKASKRPNFMKMIGTAKQKQKPFDAILLWKFSRFARNREDSIVYKSMLRKQCGIDVISVSESLGDDKMSILIEAMIEAMDEFYSINLAEEVKRGMTEKAKRGGVLSVPAYGYKVENGQYIPIPEEAAVIRQVFKRYCAGAGMLRIAKDLNAAGVRTHRGGKIENRTVEYWLQNPVYIGKIRWTPTGKTNRNYHNPDSLITDGTHERIIDNATWDKAQELMKEQKAKYRPYYRPRTKVSHWLVSICRCGLCGGPLVNCSGYLYCNNRSKGTCSGNGGMSAKTASNMVISQLKQTAASSEYISVPIEQVSGRDAEADTLKEMQLEKAKQRLTRIKEAYELGIDTAEEYAENKKRVQKEIAEIEAELNTKQESNPEEDFKELQAKIKGALSQIENPKADEAEKNRTARTFIREIVKTGPSGKDYKIYYIL